MVCAPLISRWPEIHFGASSARLAYEVEWGPDGSSTFAVAPGVVAVAIGSPGQMRITFQEGRVVVAEAVLGAFWDGAYFCYGLHHRHPRRQANEGLLIDVFTFTGALTVPAIVAEDLNATIPESAPLALHRSFGLWSIGDRSPIPVGRQGREARGEPVDHCLCKLPR